MPASIAHMLIAEAAREALRENGVRGEVGEFAKTLESHAQYMALGSLGPDLPYFANIAAGVLKLLLDRSDKPAGIDQWSYQLHSKDPNVFPLKLLEIIWRDADDGEWDEEDSKKWAFAAGFLTHIAADQIIHPFVNALAGPYYKAGENREKHRQIEILQDVLLYKERKKKDLMEACPNEWCDLNPGWGSNTETWFRFLLQKAFVEAHAVSPSEGDVENWVDGALLLLRGLNNVGPYKKAARQVEKGTSAEQEYYETIGGGKTYLEVCFKPAVELCVLYLRAANKVYKLGDDWDDDLRGKFLKVVRNADLSAPMESDILGRARHEWSEWEGERGAHTGVRRASTAGTRRHKKAGKRKSTSG